MTEGLVQAFIDFFKNLDLNKEVIVFIISLLPILELRGGLLAASLLNVDPIIGYMICIIGNVIPVPFILLLITPLFDKLKKTKLLSKFVNKIENKALSKKDQIDKYKYLGLILFVGIPLPGTGAWTGSLLACLLNMDKKKSFGAIMIGLIMASIIMMIISYGVIGNLIN